MILQGFDPEKFCLHPGHFDNQSNLHGINHTYRVMCHVLYLGQALLFEREIKLAFSAAFIHDMSRKHDGFCQHHGLWASRQKLPLFKDFFLSQGINSFQLEEISASVRNHSEGFDLQKNDPFWKTAALLKDADALDRIRLGVGNLRIEFLRFPATEQFVPFANALFQSSDQHQINSFSQMFALTLQHQHLIKFS
ncbi:MAG: HD domain-containing protein [Bacteroidales bacterium]|nr:HD domain-containing protein [Bacteroidales bacterium]MDZ4203354.1 HD domain-containing protein [Bacteroidales bacterium]